MIVAPVPRPDYTFFQPRHTVDLLLYDKLIIKLHALLRIVIVVVLLCMTLRVVIEIIEVQNAESQFWTHSELLSFRLMH